jgi:hypothetical protein
MKMRMIQVRGNWKDYVDIHALALHGIDLPTALAAAKAIDTSFDPATSIRALQFLWSRNSGPGFSDYAAGFDPVGTSRLIWESYRNYVPDGVLSAGGMEL